MYRTHNCNELNASNIGGEVTLCGWVQTIRKVSANLIFIDIRDRYGITQLTFDNVLITEASNLGREYVIQVTGEVSERTNKNSDLKTGDIEISVNNLQILNSSKTVPFTIETETDGGDEIRMKYRYLDIRRKIVMDKLILRNRVSMETRNFLDSLGFLDVETPFLIKSTPEGARDFVVPSRLHKGEFYALPQSPQTFKQLLMVSGVDKYYQITKCFRDENLRSDRQPEFTQIDCEMSFVEQEEVLNTFESLIRHLFLKVKNIDLGTFPRMTYNEAMERYGSDKPDIRFGMEFIYLTDILKNKGFNPFDDSECIIGINIPNSSELTRKQLDTITEWIKRPQIGASGLVTVKKNIDGTIKSSIDKYFFKDEINSILDRCESSNGDLVLILCGNTNEVRKQMNELRLHMGDMLGLRDPNIYKPLWVIDFPLLEWSEEENRFFAMHHPFTSPKIEDLHLLDTNPGAIRANAYDLAMNGVELGGGSIRIHNRTLQEQMFNLLGMSFEEANEQFGFLMEAFEYGAPPHGGLAFGLDRLVATMDGSDSIRDYIAFPKNNSGRDVMIDSPSSISDEQLNELNLK